MALRETQQLHSMVGAFLTVDSRNAISTYSNKHLKCVWVVNNQILKESKKPVRVIVHILHCPEGEPLIISLPSQGIKKTRVSLRDLAKKLSATFAAQLCEQSKFAITFLKKFSSCVKFSTDSICKQTNHFQYNQNLLDRQSPFEFSKSSEVFFGKDTLNQQNDRTHLINKIVDNLSFSHLKIGDLPAISFDSKNMSNEIDLEDLQHIQISINQISPVTVEEIRILHSEKEMSKACMKCDSVVGTKEKETLYLQENPNLVDKNNSCDEKNLKFIGIQNKELSSIYQTQNKGQSIIQNEEDQQEDDNQKLNNSTDFSSILEESQTKCEISFKESPLLSPISKKRSGQDLFEFESPILKKTKLSWIEEQEISIKQDNSNNNICDADSYMKFLSGINENNKKKKLNISHIKEDLSKDNFLESDSESIQQLLDVINLKPSFTSSLSPKLRTNNQSFNSEIASSSNIITSLKTSPHTTFNKQSTLSPKNKINGPINYTNNSQKQIQSSNQLQKLAFAKPNHNQFESKQQLNKQKLQQQHQKGFYQRVKYFKEELVHLSKIMSDYLKKSSKNHNCKGIVKKLDSQTICEIAKQMNSRFLISRDDVSQFISDLSHLFPSQINVQDSKYGTLLTINTTFKLTNIKDNLQKL